MLKREVFQIVSDAIQRDPRIRPASIQEIGDTIIIVDQNGYDIIIEVKTDKTCHGLLGA